MNKLRADVFERLKKNARKISEGLDFPDVKDEEWKYTNYELLQRLQEIRLDGTPNIDFKVEAGSSGVIAESLESAFNKNNNFMREYLGKVIPATGDKLAAMHYSHVAGGLFLLLPKNTHANVASSLSGENSSIHNLIVLEEGAELNYFENYSHAKGFLVDATEIVAKENSAVNFFSFQNLPKDVFHLSYKKALLHSYASCNWNYGIFGGKFSRWKVETSFEGEGSHSENTGVFFGDGNQHIDLITKAHHKVPHTTNNILARGCMKGVSSSIYRGLIKIDRLAQKSDSYLADHTLLLSKNAFANSIPSLQIEANDVRATHGATVGQIDKDQIFYLATRGLDEKNAESLIVEGFFESAMQKISNENVKKRFQSAIEGKLYE